MTTSEFQQLNSRFDEIDNRFKKIDSRFDLQDASFNELLEFLTKQFGNIEARLSNLEVNQDYTIKQIQDLRQENAFGGHKSNRMENWIIKAAKKIDLPYNPN